MPPRVASPPPVSTVAPPPPPALPRKSPVTSGQAIMRLMPAGQDKSTGFADVSPLIAAVPCVVDRTAQAGAAPPPKALQIDSGAAARALDSIGKHAKGRAASPPTLRTPPPTHLREASGASKKHDRDAASDEASYSRDLLRSKQKKRSRRSSWP